MSALLFILLGVILGAGGLLITAWLCVPARPTLEQARLQAVHLTQARAEQQLDRTVQDTVARLFDEARRSGGLG